MQAAMRIIRRIVLSSAVICDTVSGPSTAAAQSPPVAFPKGRTCIIVSIADGAYHAVPDAPEEVYSQAEADISHMLQSMMMLGLYIH